MRNRAVLSTNVSPILFMVFFVGVGISRHFNFFDIDNSIGSRSRAQMQGEAPDPCLLPNILLRLVEK